MPNCHEGVDYHRVKTNKSGTNIRISWKNLCEKHRRKGIGRDLVDRWKVMHGCNNSSGKYGIACTSTIFTPAQLQINHIDGNNLNRDPSNIEVLCGNCHTYVTQQNKHYLPNRSNNGHIADTGLFDNL